MHCRLHVFAIRRCGLAPFDDAIEVAVDGDREGAGYAATSDAPTPPDLSQRKRRETRRERIEAALEATDFRGVLDELTQEDVHVLVPRAYAHSEAHPELYQLPLPPPPPSAPWKRTKRGISKGSR